ncbi:MAG: stage II sporulation protein R [Clostridia bacterium]|nr:stage II sporulation protein R [Clostridia bacterium]
MKKRLRKNIELGVLFGLICAIAVSFFGFERRMDELREGVLRLHILANSDSEEDQQLKLKVRDRILETAAPYLENADSIEAAIAAVNRNMDEIILAANAVIKEEGFSYTATAAIEKNFFENREYDDFTLPAGEYNSLTVRIGAAGGHNWWCVVFPGVCLPSAKKSGLEKAVSAESADIAKNASRYKICFKTVEIFEKIKNKIFKR